LILALRLPSHWGKVIFEYPLQPCNAEILQQPVGCATPFNHPFLLHARSFRAWASLCHSRTGSLRIRAKGSACRPARPRSHQADHVPSVPGFHQHPGPDGSPSAADGPPPAGSHTGTLMPQYRAHPWSGVHTLAGVMDDPASGTGSCTPRTSGLPYGARPDRPPQLGAAARRAADTFAVLGDMNFMPPAGT
jgi:hypothetical protein